MNAVLRYAEDGERLVVVFPCLLVFVEVFALQVAEDGTLIRMADSETRRLQDPLLLLLVLLLKTERGDSTYRFRRIRETNLLSRETGFGHRAITVTLDTDTFGKAKRLLEIRPLRKKKVLFYL